MKIIFDKKSKKGYVYVRNNRVKRHDIPIYHRLSKEKDELHMTIRSQTILKLFACQKLQDSSYQYFQKYPIDTTDDEIREILSTDKPFIESLKEVKDSIDRAYRSIISYPNFVFLEYQSHSTAS